jgi:hypothetical protein
MRRYRSSWLPAIAILAACTLLLTACPARRPEGSPLDLQSEFLDRA